MFLSILCITILTLNFKGSVEEILKWNKNYSIRQSNSHWGEWLQWSSCSGSLNGTVQRRSRNCVGFGCTGDSEQFRACTQFISKAPSSDSFMVSQWGEWNKFGPCSVSCGGGFQSRTRLCYEKCPGCLCEGPSTEQRYCNTEKCCEWTSWSTWSQCSVTCGEGGYSYRTRQCTCEQCESGEATEQIRCRANVPCKSITKTRVCTFQLIRGEIPVRIC